MSEILTYLLIHSLWKAGDIYQQTGFRPEIVPFGDKLVFKFPRTPETETALKAHQSGATGMKDYSERIKLLRSELYLLRGDKNGGRDE